MSIISWGLQAAPGVRVSRAASVSPDTQKLQNKKIEKVKTQQELFVIQIHSNLDVMGAYCQRMVNHVHECSCISLLWTVQHCTVFPFPVVKVHTLVQ